MSALKKSACSMTVREFLQREEGSKLIMQGVDCKEHRESEGQPNISSAVPAIPWWNGFGSQFPQSAWCAPVKPLFVDHPNRVPGPVKQVATQSQQLEQPSTQVAVQSQSEGEAMLAGTRRMPMSNQLGYSGANGEKQHQHQPTKSIIGSAPTEYLVPHAQLDFNHSIACAAYPYADPYFGGILAAYPAQAMIHPNMLGVQQARMPLPLDMTEEEPVYVNAKQYHGILRRRQLRAKAESENKLIKTRKPYLHESRHLHAMKRARGCGGRFLNTKKLEDLKANVDNGKTPEGHTAQAGSSSGSEVLQSENGNGNSTQEVHGACGMSGSEVTSIAQSSENGTTYQYSHTNGAYLNHYQHPHFHISAFHPLSSGGEEGSSAKGGSIISGGSQQRVVVIQ